MIIRQLKIFFMSLPLNDFFLFFLFCDVAFSGSFYRTNLEKCKPTCATPQGPISKKLLFITCHEIVTIFSRQAAQMRREFEIAPRFGVQ